MLPGNIFGLILKNKMAARDVYSTLNKDFCWPSRAKGIMSTSVGGGHIIFAFSGVRTLGFHSFEGKVFILSLPNLAWVFIGLIACKGWLLVKIGL